MDELALEWFRTQFALLGGAINTLTQEVKKMAVNQAQLDTDLQTCLANVAVAVNEINLLVAKFTGANPPPPDFTTEDTGINAANASLVTAIAAAKAITGQ